MLVLLLVVPEGWSRRNILPKHVDQFCVNSLADMADLDAVRDLKPGTGCKRFGAILASLVTPC